MADSASRQGHGYSNPEILGFLSDLHHPHDAAAEAAFHAPDVEGMPAIQLGRAEARTLELLLRLIGAKKVVEVGTLAGYSALCMARALGPDGRLWTIENDPKHAAVARARVRDAHPIEVLEGDALEVLEELGPKGPFCAVFLDADKGRYDLYGRWAREHLRPGGLLIGDNAFLFGDLLADTETAAAMRRFHAELADGFHSVCIPTPDGLAFGIKHEA